MPLLYTSFYWDNMISFGMGPVRDENGELGITLPLGEAKLRSIAAGGRTSSLASSLASMWGTL